METSDVLPRVGCFMYIDSRISVKYHLLNWASSHISQDELTTQNNASSHEQHSIQCLTVWQA